MMLLNRQTRSVALLIAVGVLAVFSLVNVLAQSFKSPKIHLTRLFSADDLNAVMFDDSVIANPLPHFVQRQFELLVPVSDGTIYSLNGENGIEEWHIKMPAPEGQTAQLAATPVKIDNKLVVIYQCLDKGVRVSHRVAVVDLIQKKIDHSFAILTLSAEIQTADGKAKVKFNPPTQFSHAALKYAAKKSSVWGNIYASFGNAGDTQPFHGWVFEIDMEAWQLLGAQKAISNVLLTTPESDCPVTVEYGTQEMICGGGVWAPPGPQIYPSGNSYEIFLPVGNGQTDLSRQDYANTLMKVSPGLKFDPKCDAALCKNFDPVQPDEACMASCENLFIPRLMADDKALKPATGECDNKTFYECLAWMDYDLGANVPVKAKLKNGQEVLVQPGKEGGVYLIDPNHLGTQFDRMQVVGVCGTATDPCKAGWMGMIVTQPALTYLNGDPVVIISSFVPDKSHPAGLTALKIVSQKGRPTFKRLWQFPNPSKAEALKIFRSHPSLPVITKLKDSNEHIVWSVSVGDPGMLFGIRASDGKLLVEQPLRGTGRQNTAPVIHEDKVYLMSTDAKTGRAFIEAYRIASSEKK